MLKFTDIKYLDYESWFELWYEDEKAINQTMIKNCLADIHAGYNIHGNCIMNQWQAISNHAKHINDTLDMFTEFNNSEKINRWCYYDLLKRGVIE